MRHSPFGALVVALLLSTSTSSAESGSHDGFYLRAAMGAGVFTSRDTVEGTGSTTEQPMFGGSGGALEISAGGTPQPGFVLAGTVLLQSAILGTMRDSAGGVTVTNRQDFALVGATADYFPDPRRGFHVLGTLGPAFMSELRDDRIQRTWASRGGVGISIGAGYEAFVSPSWSLGFLLRANGAALGGTERIDDTTGQATIIQRHSDRSVVGMSVMFTGVYH